MSARDDLIDLAGYKYPPEQYEHKGQALYERIAAEVRAETLREAADYADRKADKYEDYSAVAAQAAYGIADGLRDMAEEEK